MGNTFDSIQRNHVEGLGLSYLENVGGSWREEWKNFKRLAIIVLNYSLFLCIMTLFVLKA